MPRKSELFTEDPFYLPRYCGYLPQYKYRIGKTYGRHSVDILTDDSVRKSGNYVISATETTRPEEIDRRRILLRSRADSWGNQNFTEQMVPGYTGYIPKRQHYFADTFGEVCRSALAHHEEEQGTNKQKQTQLKRVFALQSGSVRPTSDDDRAALTSRFQTPLNQQAPDAKRYQSKNEFKPYGSPYFMENENPMKWFKSGYTGFVPRSRELIAMGYPTQSSRGLRMFSADLKSTSELEKKESTPMLPRRAQRGQKTVIYPTNKGMIPHYTGYIPGYKYAIGHTYGQHTLNTLKLPTTERISTTA